VTESSRISCKSSWLQAPATIYVGLAGDPLLCVTCKDNSPGPPSVSQATLHGAQPRLLPMRAYAHRSRIGEFFVSWLSRLCEPWSASCRRSLCAPHHAIFRVRSERWTNQCRDRRERASTRVAWLPRMNLDRPRRPCEAITIRSLEAAPSLATNLSAPVWRSRHWAKTRPPPRATRCTQTGV
jgi:hypothetical protein